MIDDEVVLEEEAVDVNLSEESPISPASEDTGEPVPASTGTQRGGEDGPTGHSTVDASPAN